MEPVLKVLQTVLSVTALVLSFMAYVNARRARRDSFRPFLTLAYTGRGWTLLNCGRGPAIDAVLLYELPPGTPVRRVRLGPIAPGAQIDLSVITRQDVAIHVSYQDIEQDSYATSCRDGRTEAVAPSRLSAGSSQVRENALWELTGRDFESVSREDRIAAMTSLLQRETAGPGRTNE